MSSAPAPASRFLSVDEAAAHLNVSPRWIRRAVFERSIRYRKIGKFVRFDVADLDALADAGVQEPVRR